MKINPNDLGDLFDEEDGVETRRNKGNKKKPTKIHDGYEKRDSRKPNKHKRHDRDEEEY